MKQYFFLSGLPRAGSTLLSTLLNQNPEIYASTNSPVCGTIANVVKEVQLSEQYRAFPRPEVLPALSLGVLNSYYQDISQPFIVDKSREWASPEHYGLLKEYLPYQPKIIVLVRDVLEILASFVALANKSPAGESSLDKQITTAEFHFYRPIDDIRCDFLMKPKGLIDSAMYGVANALSNYSSGDFLLIEYNDLVSSPTQTMSSIYSFFDLPEFSHNFSSIESTMVEDDSVYGLVGMHDVRSTLSKSETDKMSLSSYVQNKYSGLEFWSTK